MTLVLGVDPGVRACGYAVLELGKNIKKRMKVIYANDPVANRQNPNWWMFIDSLTEELEDIFNGFNIKQVYCECPRVMGGLRGKAAAGRSDIIHLAHHMGIVAHVARMWDATFTPVEVAQWKGNLKDAVVWERVGRPFPPEDSAGNLIKKHALDAVGIGVCGFYDTDMRNASLWGKG